MSQELALLIERSADLKRDLVRFAQPALRMAADRRPAGRRRPGELDEAVAIGLFEIRSKARDAISHWSAKDCQRLRLATRCQTQRLVSYLA